MNLSDKEKEEFAHISLSLLNTNFSKEEKEIFYKFLQVQKTNDYEYFLNMLTFFYEKNNSIELDILKLKQQVDCEYNYTNDELKILKDFFLITPCILSIYIETIRQIGTLEDILNVYYAYINNFNKIIDSFPIGIEDKETKYFINTINNWVSTLKIRIQETKEQIEYNNTINITATIKIKPILKWEGNGLEKLSKKLNSFGYTNKPTDFEKVFTEHKPTNWLGEHAVLAYLLYKLGGNEIEKKKITTSGRLGYMNVASLYFYNCDSVILSQQKNYLNDLSYKVRKSKEKYTETIEFIDSLLDSLNS